MSSRSWVVWAAGVIVLVWSTMAVVQAQSVTVITDAAPPTVSSVCGGQGASVIFCEITDAVPGRFFDAATTTQVGNKLRIGLSKGFDAATWTVKEFTASTAAFHHAFAMDTISFLVEAPKGFYIGKITYSQTGTSAVARTARAAGGVHWVVDGVAADLSLFDTTPTLSGTVDLYGQDKSSVPVSITCSLFTFAPPRLGAATISLTSAEVVVELYTRGQ